MTLTNRELFARDPIENRIPNKGVAKIQLAATGRQLDVLKWELRNFVCEGEYERGLERILNSFLTNLTNPEQPAVWVSGFYGSGKSHLVRVLEHLWLNDDLDGERPRDLVHLPADIKAHLTELNTAGKRAGGLWSAAGTLGAGRSSAIRLAFLSVLFESARLPQEYGPARFVMWARRHGYLDAIADAVESEGRALDDEVKHLYVSPYIAKALLEADPTLGNSATDIRALLREQFPREIDDITDAQMFSAMEDVLEMQSSAEGKFPLTLVVLDEMQQYIGDDNERALAVQNIVEGCASRFESTVMIVATGQSAMTTAAPTLQKLTDRWPVKVELSDTDVEAVVRKVVLEKKPKHVPELKATLERRSGEIDKHLAGTQLEARGDDKKNLVPDYPLLPTRRRFWERALRAIDKAGQTGVLRTQLKIVHEAAEASAPHPVGHVIGADFLYDAQSAAMLQSGVLLKEIHDRIHKLRSDGEAGRLRARLCGLVFLIGQIPKEHLGKETGLRATKEILVDLLVEDLADDRSRLASEVPPALQELVDDGTLIRVNDEYQLQTKEGAEWDKDFQRRRSAIRDNAARIAGLRNERLLQGVDKGLSRLTIPHGASKLPRKIADHWGDDEPDTGQGSVPVWIRDEWAVTEASVKRTAAEAGDDSSTVFVLLPKSHAEEIKAALTNHAAAEETMNGRPVPQTEEGKTARRAMEGRIRDEDERLKELFNQVIAKARVFQGGGSEVAESSFRASIEEAAKRSLSRMFPKFRDGDNAHWDKVVSHARDGGPDALKAVAHHGDSITHRVCKEVLATIPGGGIDGREVQKLFTAPPFGWPPDAVNGAILVLLADGRIRATHNGQDVAGPKELPKTQIGNAQLYKEDEPPTGEQKLAVRGLLTKAGIEFESGQEGPQIPALMQHLKGIARSAGGEPPLPERPDVEHIEAHAALAGNQQFRAVADDHERLEADLTSWQQAADAREQREASWSELQRLLKHAASLEIAEALTADVDAIRDARQLLNEPDPVRPLLDQVRSALRHAMTALIKQLNEGRASAAAELEAWEAWENLDPGDREQILEESKLQPDSEPNLEDDNLLGVLDATSLSSLRDRVGLVASRLDQAREKALKKLEPESVQVSMRRTTIKSADDLDRYVDEVRDRIKPYLDDGKTVIV